MIMAHYQRLPISAGVNEKKMKNWSAFCPYDGNCHHCHGGICGSSCGQIATIIFCNMIPCCNCCNKVMINPWKT